MRSKRYLVGLAVCCFIMVFGINTAFAGGSSDSSGDGFHCYLFFTLPDGTFAQVMINDSSERNVEDKAVEMLYKYIDDLGGELDVAVGNIVGPLCPPLDYLCTWGSPQVDPVTFEDFMSDVIKPYWIKKYKHKVF